MDMSHEAQGLAATSSETRVAADPDMDSAARIAQDACEALANHDVSSEDADKTDAAGVKAPNSGKRKRGRRGGIRKRRSSGASGADTRPYDELTWEEQREREERANVGTVVRRLSGVVQPPRAKRGKGQGRRNFNAEAVRPSAPLFTTQDLIEKKVTEEMDWTTVDDSGIEPTEDTVPYGFEEQYETNQAGPHHVSRDDIAGLSREELITMLMERNGTMKDLMESNAKLVYELGRTEACTGTNTPIRTHDA